MNSIHITEMYHTGFLPPSIDKQRLAQGLPSQTISNNCIWNYQGGPICPLNLYPTNVTRPIFSGRPSRQVQGGIPTHNKNHGVGVSQYNARV